MTAINDIRDLLQILREQPDWADQVRAVLLSQELLELPGKVAILAATVETINRRLDRLEQDVAELKTDVAELKTDVAELKTDVKDLKAGQKTIIDDVGFIKGRYAGDLAVMDAPDIAEAMGYEYRRTLTREQIREISRPGQGSVASNRLLSFRHADLVIEAVQDSEITYIAVEASFTADERDTRRAMDNAALLTRFTGSPARPAIASVRNTDEVLPLIGDNRLHWHPLDHRHLAPE